MFFKNVEDKVVTLQINEMSYVSSMLIRRLWSCC